MLIYFLSILDELHPNFMLFYLKSHSNHRNVSRLEAFFTEKKCWMGISSDIDLVVVQFDVQQGLGCVIFLWYFCILTQLSSIVHGIRFSTFSPSLLSVFFTFISHLLHIGV